LELGERKKAILCAIIEEYVSSGMPVSSRTVADRYGQWSSATIRNEMNELESMGLLVQPHISAGRVPSNHAYRMYVDHMMSVCAMSANEAERMRGYLQARVRNIGQVVQATATAVAQLTHYTTMLVLPTAASARVEHIHFVPIGPGRALMVLVTDAGVFKDNVLRVPEGITASELANIAALMSQHLHGRTLDDLTRVLAQMAGLGQTTEPQVIDEMMRLIQHNLESLQRPSVVLGGAMNMLRHAQESEMPQIKRLLLRMEMGEAQLLLARRMTPETMAVVIGDETGLEDFDNMAIVSVGLRGKESRSGAIGVIGPARMPYPTVLAQLRMISKTLEELLGGEFY